MTTVLTYYPLRRLDSSEELHAQSELHRRRDLTRLARNLGSDPRPLQHAVHKALRAPAPGGPRRRRRGPAHGRPHRAGGLGRADGPGMGHARQRLLAPAAFAVVDSVVWGRGGTGRRRGLKILGRASGVPVRFRAALFSLSVASDRLQQRRSGRARGRHPGRADAGERAVHHVGDLGAGEARSSDEAFR